MRDNQLHLQMMKKYLPWIITERPPSQRRLPFQNRPLELMSCHTFCGWCKLYRQLWQLQSHNHVQILLSTLLLTWRLNMADFIDIRCRGFKTSKGRGKILFRLYILDWPALLRSLKVSLLRANSSRSFFQRLISIYQSWIIQGSFYTIKVKIYWPKPSQLWRGVIRSFISMIPQRCLFRGVMNLAIPRMIPIVSRKRKLSRPRK